MTRCHPRSSFPRRAREEVTICCPRGRGFIRQRGAAVVKCRLLNPHRPLPETPLMKRLLGLTAAVAVLAAAAAVSQGPKVEVPAPGPDLRIEVGEKNPWTNLKLNNDPREFRFAIVSDRTGGHRAQIFSRAVERLNLMQPEFVLSVGDLIEGYSEEREKLDKQWGEFHG